MKKSLLFLLFFNFLITHAQTPSLTFTNVTGSNSITCNTSSINVLASVNNYTNSPLTYTWVSLSASFSGTNVSINTSGNYTVTAYNTANSFSLTQIFSIGINTVNPTISFSVTTHTLTCSEPTVVVQGSSTSTNVLYNWTFPVPGNAITNTIIVSTTSVPTNTFIGTYSLTVMDNSNACASTSVISFYQNISAPSPSIAGPNTAPCSSPVVTYTFVGSSNVPAIFFPTQPAIGHEWYGPVPQASLSNSNTYTASTAGVYTLVVLDLNNGCTSIGTKTLVFTGTPQISSPTPFNINCPTPTVMIYPTVTGATSGLTYSWSVPATASVSSLITQTITTNSPGIYTVTVTGSITSCSSTTTVAVAICAGISENDNAKNFISIYPNPANNKLTIQFSSDEKGYTKSQVLNSIGQIVKEIDLDYDLPTINISDLPDGIYFLKLISEKSGAVSKRFVVAH